MTIWPQEDHADLGLIEDDNTPDMRKPATTDTAKHLVTGSESTTHEGADL